MIKYSIGTTLDGRVYELPNLTFNTFRDADNATRQIYREYYHEEPTLSGTLGAYFNLADKSDDAPEYMVWNHTERRVVREADLYETDADAETIINENKAYLASIEGKGLQPHNVPDN